MDPIIRNFLNFFQDYINICQLPCWPNNTTSHEEILSAFKVAEHIKNCLERLNKKSLKKDFLSAVTTQNQQCTSSLFFKQCFADPPKYILKKVIISSCDFSTMDYAFQLFIELFSESELEINISEFILEAASKDTLLKSLSTELKKEALLEFKVNFLLTELTYGINKKNIVVDMLTSDCTQDIVDLLVLSTLNRETKYHLAINTIVEGLSSVMLSTCFEMRTFWKCLFKIEEITLIQFCIEHNNLFHLIIKALTDCCQILFCKQSMDNFYLEITHSELKAVVKLFCKNEILKGHIYDNVSFLKVDEMFWDDLIS